MHLDLSQVRKQFPALNREDVFFDNPGGTQVATQVIDRMTSYLTNHNANHGGVFRTSVESDAVLDEARAAVADFYNASRPEEIVFGPNMTTLTLSLSRAIARTIQPGDTLVVTRLDHDANISPWMQIAEDRGAQLEWVDFDVEDGTLRLETLETALEKKPKLVAVGYASNALGTINPIKKITQMAKQVGALVFIDAVQYAPHGTIDVQDIGCDFLAASAYKYFGPHMGTLYGRYELLDELRAYKVRPAPQDPPGKFETGTQNHEGIAGVLGALEYFEWVGETFGSHLEVKARNARQGKLRQGMAALGKHERAISLKMLEVLGSVPGLTLYGLNDPDRVHQRVATFAFNLAGWTPQALAEFLAEKGIYVWNGNYYALSVTQRLGVEDTGGMVRVGPVHYNTLEEVERLGKALLEAAHK